MFACRLKKPLDDLRAKLQTALSEARAGHEGNAGNGDCVAVFAYLDDTIAGVPADLADRALYITVETFAAAGHTIHPARSACWSDSSERSSLPSVCQEIWSENGSKIGSIPAFNASQEPVLAEHMFAKKLSQIEREAEFLLSILFDDQKAAVDN